jgi:hypothetical protein
MKKSKLIVALLFLCSFSAGAQFLYSIGIGAGINYGKEGWNEERYAAQEHYLMKYHGAVLAEFFGNPVYKWRSEIMYNMLGTKELYLTDTYVNSTTFISFNNYLKYQHEFFKWIPYLLIGPRVEYLYSRGGQFADVIGGEFSFHVSGAVGVGIEPVWFSHFKVFMEVFYNHDIMPSFIGSINSLTPPPLNYQMSEVIMKHDYELRIGLKYVFEKHDKCPHVDNPAGT